MRITPIVHGENVSPQFAESLISKTLDNFVLWPHHREELERYCHIFDVLVVRYGKVFPAYRAELKSQDTLQNAQRSRSAIGLCFPIVRN